MALYGGAYTLCANKEAKIFYYDWIAYMTPMLSLFNVIVLHEEVADFN